MLKRYGCLSQKIPNIFILKDPTPPAQPIAGYNAPFCSESILNLSASSPTSSIPGPINYIWVGPAFGTQPGYLTKHSRIFSISIHIIQRNLYCLCHAKQLHLIANKLPGCDKTIAIKTCNQYQNTFVYWR